MRPLQTDLSVFNKFKFEKPPIGVKFQYFKPEGIPRLDKSLAFCEMIKEAQRIRTPFYFTKENENCFGKVPLGMQKVASWGEGGEFGASLEIFQEPRANARIYQYVPKFPEGTVNYVALSSLDKLTFEPDLLILIATPSQAEIVLRAMSYSTGQLWESKVTGVLGCAWIFVYPYKSGRINYMPTGITFCAKALEPIPEGWILISIPWDWLPIITQNLKEMKWVLPSYSEGRERYLKRKESLIAKLTRKAENP
ncbi:MAG: DUF169 domain-containing protein [Chloroflexi bacterium]|nr:DUF169 domain-containing protein [Chloroflexota bacterium]